MPQPKGLQTVKVVIRAKERISYHKVAEIPLEALEEFEAAVKRNESDLWFSQWADRFLDPLNDVNDGGEYEDVECDRVKSGPTIKAS